jgi:hypothetical protein
MTDRTSRIIAAVLIPWGLAIAGCGLTPQGDAARQYAANRGASVHDTSLENAEFYLCRAASVGSVKRRYGVTHEKAQAWREICDDLGDVNIIEPDLARDSGIGAGQGGR